MIDGWASGFEKCKNNYAFVVKSSDVSQESKDFALRAFSKTFGEMIKAHHSEHGLLRTSYARKQYCRQNFNIIEPEQVPIILANGEDTGCHLHYVPIFPLKTLEKLLRNENIRYYVEHPDKKSRKAEFFDFSDGNVLKNNNFFMVNVNGLKMILYQDSFEVCNPIGASKGKFKIVAVYLLLGNLLPHLRSKVRNVQLVLLCLEKYISKYGWEIILKKVINDLNVLATDGIELDCTDGTVKYRGTLVLMLGDSLGSHQIGRLTENFSKSHNFCRFCEILRAQLQANDYSPKALQTPESYKECVSEALRSGKMVKGIKKDSPLNQITSYHVCNPGLPPCIAHDLFEGIVQYDLMLAIKNLFKKSGSG